MAFPNPRIIRVLAVSTQQFHDLVRAHAGLACAPQCGEPAARLGAFSRPANVAHHHRAAGINIELNAAARHYPEIFTHLLGIVTCPLTVI